MTINYRDHLLEIKDLLLKKLEQAQHEYYTLALEIDAAGKSRQEQMDTAVFIEEMHQNRARLKRIIEEIMNNLKNLESSGQLKPTNA
jgi:hypothetical protein